MFIIENFVIFLFKIQLLIKLELKIKFFNSLIFIQYKNKFY